MGFKLKPDPRKARQTSIHHVVPLHLQFLVLVFFRLFGLTEVYCFYVVIMLPKAKPKCI